MKRTAIVIATVIAGSASMPGIAQTAGVDAAGAIEGVTLPAEFKGRWDFQRRFSNIWSVRFERVDADGALRGRITFYGRRCNARDEPFRNAFWREGQLTIIAAGGAECGDMRFSLRRGKERFFEGEARADYDSSVVSQVWLDAPR